MMIGLAAGMLLLAAVLIMGINGLSRAFGKASGSQDSSLYSAGAAELSGEDTPSDTSDIYIYMNPTQKVLRKQSAAGVHPAGNLPTEVIPA